MDYKNSSRSERQNKAQGAALRAEPWVWIRHDEEPTEWATDHGRLFRPLRGLQMDSINSQGSVRLTPRLTLGFNLAPTSWAQEMIGDVSEIAFTKSGGAIRSPISRLEVRAGD